MQSEISNLKADDSILEEEIIKMLDEVQNVENALKEEKERFHIFQNECNEKKSELEKKLKEDEERLLALETKKEPGPVKT